MSTAYTCLLIKVKLKRGHQKIMEKAPLSEKDVIWNLIFKKQTLGTSLAVQWLRLCTPNAGGMGSIPGQGTKIPHATW